jgi:phage regulator Rha-like protein
MNTQLLKLENNITMSSLDIAELTGKEHCDVLRDIRVTLEQAEIGESEFASTYKSKQNKTLPCFNLPRRECDLVISGYSVKYRLAIIDRWQELEQEKLLNGYKVPTTYLEAMEMVVIKEKERLELEKKINTSTLFPDKEKVFDGERGYKKDVCDVYPFLHNPTVTLILEYYTKSKYKETRSYIKSELDVVEDFFADCDMRVSMNTVIVDHPCLLGAQLRIKKVFAIKYLGYTEENFKLSQSNN